MEMRVCETIPSRRLGDLCPKGDLRPFIPALTTRKGG